MYPHRPSGANRPESKTTRMFRPVRQVTAPVGRCLVEIANWRYRRRSLPSPSPTASCFQLGLLLPGLSSLHDSRCSTNPSHYRVLHSGPIFVFSRLVYMPATCCSSALYSTLIIFAFFSTVCLQFSPQNKPEVFNLWFTDQGG